jgi:excisionase family DNA binding protein
MDQMVQQYEDLPPILTPLQAAQLLQIGRTRGYQLCHVKGFPAVRIGKTFRIPRDRLIAWINAGGLDQEAPPPMPRRRQAPHQAID